MNSEETKCVENSTLLCDHHLIFCKVREISNTFNNLNSMLRKHLGERQLYESYGKNV
jgi:hypothetical protein